MFALSVLVLLVAAGGLVTRFGVMTPPGRLLIEASTSGLKLGRAGKLRIEGLSGDIWGAFGIRKLTISDEAGVWLQADQVVVDWHSAELFRRRLHATRLSAQQLRVIRRPTLTPAGVSSGLPLAFVVDQLRAHTILEPAFSNQRGDLDLTGAFAVERNGAAKGQVIAASRLHAGDGLRADFDVGGTSQVRVNAEAMEAQGGALAGSFGLNSTLPFSMSAHANGTVDRGQFTFVTRSGGQTPLDASGAWAPEGGSAKAKILLAASSLMNGNVKRFGPAFDLSVSGRRNAKGLQDVVLDARAENLIAHVAGPVDMTKRSTAGMKVDLQVADMNRLTAFPHLGSGRVTGVLSGDSGDWIVKGQGTAHDTRMAGWTVAQAQGPVSVARKNGILDIKVDLTASGGSGQTIFAAWMGPSPHAAVSLTRFADHRFLIRSLAGEGAGFTLKGSGDRNLFDTFSFAGDLRVTNVDAIHHGAKGELNGHWAAHKGKPGTPWTFSVDGRGANFATGYAELDRLLGATPKLDGDASLKNGRWSFAKLGVDGDKAGVSGAGVLEADQSLRFNLDWRAKGPFHAGPVEIAGDVKGDGALTGTLTAPRADLKAQIASIDLPDLTVQPVQLALTFTRTPGGGDGSIQVTGRSAYGEAFAKAGFRFRDDGLDLTDIDARGGGVTAAGSLALRGRSPSKADLSLTAGPGAFLSAGRAQAVIQIVDQGASPQAQMRLTVTDLRPKDSEIVVRSMILTANGPLSQLPYQVSADISLPQAPMKFSGNGVASEKGNAWNASFQGTGKIARADLKTLTPLMISFGGPETVAAGAIGIGSGRADFRASQSQDSISLDARLQNVDLGVASEDLAGKVSGALALSGRGPRLSGTIDANLIDARSRDGPPELAITGQVSAKLDGAHATITGSATNARGLRSAVSVSLPTETSAAPLRIAIVRSKPISGRFDVDGELQPIWDLFFGGARSLGGHVTAQGTLAGTLNDPKITGQAKLASGRFEDQATGLKLKDVAVSADLTADQITFTQFTGADGRGGSLSGQGRLSLDRGGSSTFTLNANRFMLIDNELGEAQASGAITVTRAAEGRVKLTGRLTLDRADIVAKPPTPSGVTPLEVVERNRPPERADAFAPPTARGPAVALDVYLTAPRRVFLKGRGLDAELSLDAHVTGDTARPQLEGTARVVRGDYQFASKRFEFDDRGVVYLATTTDRIRLDLTATREDPTLTAVVKISGTAAKPVVLLTSTPVLPQDEVLSQVLFGRTASQLGPVEAAQVASALSGLASGGGLDVIGNLRTLAGLDRLAFASGGAGSTAVAVSGGKYLTDDVYLEVTGGGREGPSAQVEWRVKKTLSIVSKLAGAGDSKLSIRWRRDYGKASVAK